MLTLASATERVVALEALQQAQHRKDLAGALEEVSQEQSLVLLAVTFLLRDEPGPAVMDNRQCADWIKAGMPPRGLPLRLRPVLAQAQGLARDFVQTLDQPGATAELPPQLVDFACWLTDLEQD
jgi:hypothetical protein